ncbi:UPF0149 family protein [Glaciimonas soli]|uniref:UPF0149 family protein n=1 Tax=Glaciimonas soli TaxID=2590999 RepID=A0A843YJM0_9BURK|nr:UPF0149 family protein [Glaciimonas soli]MQQ99978.1 UPF0149 family protein [Glaciimonas soli]
MELDEPLSDKEFDELDDFLLSDRCGEESMTMDILHGYLTALVIGPEQILLGEWLPFVWGPTLKDAPKFKNDKEFERIVGLIARFMNEIAVTLEVAPKEYEPLFCEFEHEGKPLLDGEAWSLGFMEGVNLRAQAWEPIWSSNLATVVEPIRLLAEKAAEESDNEETLSSQDAMQLHKLTIEVEAAIPEIYRYWLPNRKSAVKTIQRETPKVGRNDLCGCGSGKKFKKCCGAGSVED